jgi:hypothetical protein
MIDSTIVFACNFLILNNKYYKGKVTKSDKLLDGIDIKILSSKKPRYTRLFDI